MLGDRIDVVFLHAQGRSGVAYRPAGAVAVLHAHEADAFRSEAFEDLLVDVVALGGFDVDVDVGQGGAFAGEEAFEEQVVGQGVYLADADEVVHQGGGAGAAGGGAHPHAP